MTPPLSLLSLLFLGCTHGKVQGHDTSADSGSPGDDSGNPTDGGGGPTDGGGDTGPPPPDPTLALTGPAVIDPLRTGALDFSLAGTDVPAGATVTLTLVPPSGGGGGDSGSGDSGSAPSPSPDSGTSGDSGSPGDPVPVVLASGLSADAAFTWDGHDPDGRPVMDGAWSLQAALVDDTGTSLAQAEQVVHVVRTGVVMGRFGGSGAEDDQRIALLWYRASGASGYWDDGATEPAFRLGHVSEGVGALEAPIEIPAVWADLASPPTTPTGVNLPAAFAWDDHPTLSLSFAALGDAAKAATWTAELDGWDLVEGDPTSGHLVFRKTAALAPDGPRVVEGDLSLHLLADGLLIGTQTIPTRLYATMGAPTFASSSSPNLLWTAAADGALRGIEGVAPEDSAVLDALVTWVYDEAGLRYDTRSGASFYASYSGGWGGGRLNMRGFLDRANGTIVNCSDCAGIMGAFANMLGVPLDYAIILSNFSLNEIKAIGVDSFTSCPFGPSGCGFSYHAVTTDDLSSHIWDATLNLDGDEDPGAEPWDELRVQQITGDEYLERLVRSGTAGYYYDDSRIQVQ